MEGVRLGLLLYSPPQPKDVEGDGLNKLMHGLELLMKNSRSTPEAEIAGRCLIRLPHLVSKRTLYTRRDDGRSSTTPDCLRVRAAVRTWKLLHECLFHDNDTPARRRQIKFD